MARKAREKSSTGMYNIIAKSTDVLFRSEADYDFFIGILKEYISDVYAYALTPYYICLAAKESENGIGMDMKPLITKYARYYNRTYNSEGKIFDGRFKSEPINDEKELKNSIAILSNIATLCGDGITSKKPVKNYDMISFYAKLLRAESTPAKKAAPVQKAKTPVKKATEKKPEVKEEVKKSTHKNSEQQRKNLPTWLL